MRRILVILSMLALLLSGCSEPITINESSHPLSPVEESKDNSIDFSSEEQSLLSSERVDISPTIHIVGNIPEKGIALYYVNSFEMLLETENSRQLMPWHAHANYDAKMDSYDIDGDGVDEIVVNTVTWIGTEVHMEELHVVKTNEDGPFIFSSLTGEDCANLLNHRFSMTFDEDEKIVDLYFDGDKYSIDVSYVNQCYEEYELKGLSHIDFDHWIEFELNEKNINVNINIGLYATNPLLLLPFVTIPFRAEVQYTNNIKAFQLVNCMIDVPTSPA